MVGAHVTERKSERDERNKIWNLKYVKRSGLKRKVLRLTVKRKGTKGKEGGNREKRKARYKGGMKWKEKETRRYCWEGEGAGRSLVRSPVMRYGRYGNAAPWYTHTGITARPTIEQSATSLWQYAGEGAVKLSHIE